MSTPELKSLDDFQRFATDTIKTWSSDQRAMLAAAMAERWLPVSMSFSDDYGWGDPKTFQDAVQCVWRCVLDDTVTPKEIQLHKKRVEKNTPHLDDFDCEEVIATSAMIDYALSCSETTDNADDAVMALVSGFEAVAPGIYTDAGELPPEVWESPEVQDELKQELKPAIDNASLFNEQEIDALREKIMAEGQLPPEIWESPQIHDHLETVLKLSKALSNIQPIMAQKMEALREIHMPPGAAEQASRDIWQLPEVQDELRKQLTLLKLIGDTTPTDEQQIATLRRQLVSPELVGSIPPRSVC